MNEFQTQLWNNLIQLAQSTETFYYADQVVDDKTFRIFNYRLASYQEFVKPSALECRGHMFEISGSSDDAIPIRLATMPFPKFFNYKENPFTENVDLAHVCEIAHKMDGSLISSFMYDDSTLRLKTKGSLHSDQAISAMEWLNHSDNTDLKLEIIAAERLGYTINMEWVAPDNRIVIGYDTPHLIILGIRSKIDGSYVYYEDVDGDIFPNILKAWTKIERIDDTATFLNSVSDMNGIEGFVCRMPDGQLFKLKSLSYIALHHSKDSINSPRRLFEVVLEEASDDLRTMFHDDPSALKLIEDMEQFVDGIYNHMVASVEEFYEANKHLERKEYAIKGQRDLNRMYFGLAMNRYCGKEVNYKTFLKSKWKDLGLKDSESEE